MGRMKEIFVALHNDGLEELDRLIKTAVRLNSDRVTWMGKSYSIEDAKQIHIWMANEKRNIDRTNQFVEGDPDRNY